MIALPAHPCVPDEAGVVHALPYGELDLENVATCTVRIRWGVQRSQDVRLPGCRARLAVCHGCGLRTRIDGAPCPACGGVDRPEVMNVDGGPMAEHEAIQEAESVAADRPTLAPVAMGTVAVDGPGKRDDGARRPAKAKAPAKPRAARKVKVDPPEAQDLPLFK